MKRHVYILFLLLSFAFSVSAQEKEARKIDEFGKLGCDDYLARMDNAINEASNNPTSTVYILIYEGKEMKYNSRKRKDELVNPVSGSAKAKIDSIKKYVSLRKFPIKNFAFIESGFREESAIEIWIVPKGVLPPKPTPTLTNLKYRKGKAQGFCTDCC